MQLDFQIPAAPTSSNRGTDADATRPLTVERDVHGRWFMVEDPDNDPWFQSPPSFSAAKDTLRPPRQTVDAGGWLDGISLALSWILRQFVEGFAACGQAMHPGFFEPPEHDDSHARRTTGTQGPDRDGRNS